MFPNKMLLLLAMSSAFALLASTPGFAEQCKQLPRFEDYPANDVFKGKLAEPKLVTEESKMYRTRIREGAKKGPDFAGYYTAVIVGCGTSCGILFIVDVKSGSVFHQPNVDITGHNQPEIPFGGQEQFRLNSRLMIAFRPNLGESQEEAEKMLPDDILFYEWKNDEFHLICEKRPPASAQKEGNAVTTKREQTYK